MAKKAKAKPRTKRADSSPLSNRARVLPTRDSDPQTGEASASGPRSAEVRTVVVVMSPVGALYLSCRSGAPATS
jgi:hypothetical protein